MQRSDRSAADYLPPRPSLKSLRAAAAACKGCDLYKAATQTVFGEGAARATIVLVGEQPGDVEDREGRPFVGPAGRILHSALEDAGIDERAVYITNAVKHFRYVLRGKRRIHSKPKRFEIVACEPWLAAELRAIKPRIVVALGATAASALLGTAFRLTEQRGQIVASPLAARVVATYHPSAVLRAIDARGRREQMAALVDDLRVARAAALV